MGSKTKVTSTGTQSGTQTGTSTTSTGETPDIARLRGAVTAPAVNPALPYIFAGERNRQGQTYNNPLGAYTSPAVRDAANRSAGQGLSMQEAVQSEASLRAAQDQNFGQLSYIAGLTAPHTVDSNGTQTGTYNGTQTQQYNPGIGSYIAQGAGIGVGLL